ncbi:MULTISPECIES: nuclear transport factor 2-like protein [unclassified Streptomyces]|uniref:hypothetical protein n=1 Tax=unclassified Streptomyces TaxID=2593676 RepID=UPI00378B1982
MTATTAVEKNMALLRTAYRLVESGDLDAAGQLLSEDFVANVRSHRAAGRLPQCRGLPLRG